MSAAAGGEATEKLRIILGDEGLARLADATVMVLGIGGVGSNCVEALARGGIGRLIILDGDEVQESNVNRQAIAFTSTIGQPKVAVMSAMIDQINPAITVMGIHRFLTADEVEETLDPFAGQVDYLIDCIDTISTKLALARYAQDQPFSFISSMGAANKLRPERLRFADLYETHNCRLCRIMRKEGRKRGIRSCRVLYSDEDALLIPIAEGEERRDKGNLGTVSYMPAIMGQMIAAEVIRQISGVGGWSER